MRIRYLSFLFLLEVILSAQAIHTDPFTQSIHPYTVEFVRYGFLVAYPRNSEPGPTTIRAMSSDGVSVQRQFYPKGNPLEGLENVQVITSVDVTTTIVDPLNRVKRTYQPPPMYRRNVFDPTCKTHKPYYYGDDQKKDWTLVSDKEEVAGIPVVKWSVEVSDFMMEEYQAPDCNCLPLRTRSITKDEETGEIIGISDEIATKVLLGEPDEELFSLPPDLKEVSPGEFLKYIEARQGPNIP